MIRIRNTFYIILCCSNDIKIKEDDHRIFYKSWILQQNLQIFFYK